MGYNVEIGWMVSKDITRDRVVSGERPIFRARGA